MHILDLLILLASASLVQCAATPFQPRRNGDSPQKRDLVSVIAAIATQAASQITSTDSASIAVETSNAVLLPLGAAQAGIAAAIASANPFLDIQGFAPEEASSSDFGGTASTLAGTPVPSPVIETSTILSAYSSGTLVPAEASTAPSAAAIPFSYPPSGTPDATITVAGNGHGQASILGLPPQLPAETSEPIPAAWLPPPSPPPPVAAQPPPPAPPPPKAVSPAAAPQSSGHAVPNAAPLPPAVPVAPLPASGQDQCNCACVCPSGSNNVQGGNSAVGVPPVEPAAAAAAAVSTASSSSESTLSTTSATSVASSSPRQTRASSTSSLTTSTSTPTPSLPLPTPIPIPSPISINLAFAEPVSTVSHSRLIASLAKAGIIATPPAAARVPLSN